MKHLLPDERIRACIVLSAMLFISLLYLLYLGYNLYQYKH